MFLKKEYALSDNIPDNKSLSFCASSKCKKLGSNYYSIYLNHFESNFSEFAFDIIAMLKGNYNPNILSSLYGMGSTQWEKGSAVDIRYFKPDDVKKFREANLHIFPNKE